MILTLAFYAIIALGLYTAYRQFRTMVAFDPASKFETFVVLLFCTFWPIALLLIACVTVPSLLTIMIWSAYKRFKTEE